MVNPTPPEFKSQIANLVEVQPFVAIQSGQLVVSNSGGTGSASIIFTCPVGTQRVTAVISNSGSKGVYIASGSGSATAVASSSTPTPTTGANCVSTCHYIPAGAVETLGFIGGTNTFAAICAGTDTSTLEISIGYGS
jgi:hypothetical protein